MDTLAADAATILTDRALLINEGLTSGSGQTNLHVFVPEALFSGVAANEFLFVHYREGDIGSWTVASGAHDYGNAGGFEEFGIVTGLGSITTLPATVTTTFVPETGSWSAGALVLGLGFGLGTWFPRRPDAPRRKP